MNPSMPASEEPLVGVHMKPMSATVVAMRLTPCWAKIECPCICLPRLTRVELTFVNLRSGDFFRKLDDEDNQQYASQNHLCD